MQSGKQQDVSSGKNPNLQKLEELKEWVKRFEKINEKVQITIFLKGNVPFIVFFLNFSVLPGNHGYYLINLEDELGNKYEISTMSQRRGEAESKRFK